MHIVVVGGGPAGAVAAITLAGRGLEVSVIESNFEPPRKVGECLMPGANELLRTLGLFDRMESSGHLPSAGNRTFWGSSEAAERNFFFGTKGEGWHLDRARFESDLAQIARSAGVHWHVGRRLRAAERDRGSWRLTVEAPGRTREFRSRFVIDATGRSRIFSRRQSTADSAILPGGEPDRLVGFAGTIAPPSDSGRANADLCGGFTVIEAMECGWWYSALLGDGRLVAVAMTDADLLPKGDPWRTSLASSEETRRRIERHGGELEGAPTARRAAGSCLRPAQGAGWIAVGDAAFAFDPLSSYGITSAMGTAYYGAQAVADTLNGELKALAVYQTLLDQTWERYLLEHARHYAMEQRWPHSPFWARRHVG